MFDVIEDKECNKIQVGDKVAYTTTVYKRGHLRIGIIERIDDVTLPAILDLKPTGYNCKPVRRYMHEVVKVHKDA